MADMLALVNVRSKAPRLRLRYQPALCHESPGPGNGNVLLFQTTFEQSRSTFEQATIQD